MSKHDSTDYVGINDQLISEFEIAKFQSLMHGYGAQAVDHAKSLLEAWHDQHHWKSKTSKVQVQADAESADLVDSSI